MPLPSKEKFRCEILSWKRVAGDAKKLSWIIKDSGYDPDIVVAIGRGGYVPARILCDYLLINDLTTIKAEHWGTAGTQKKKAVIKFPLGQYIKNKRVLLVDDLTDTGETLEVTLKHLRSHSPKVIRSATLIHKTCSLIVPDYYTRKMTKWRWVIFPWHLWEDLVGFIGKLKAMGIHHEEAIARELRLRYGINIQINTIKEALSRMKNHFVRPP